MRRNERLQKEEALDRVLTAIADPTRRAILRRLTAGEASVTELAEPFSISLNAVSKHIVALERAGLVQRRRVWREHLVSFRSAGLDQAAVWIEEQRTLWARRLTALDDVLQAEDRAAETPTKGNRGKKGIAP